MFFYAFYLVIPYRHFSLSAINLSNIKKHNKNVRDELYIYIKKYFGYAFNI